MTFAVSARRRAASLGSAGGPLTTGPLESWLASLWLPADPTRLARVAPWALVAVLLMAAVAGGPVLVALVAAASGGVAIVLRRGAARRRGAAVDRELPQVLEAVARYLRSGGSLAQAISGASPVTTGPTAEPWARLVSDIPVAGVVAALERWGSDADRPVQPSERLAAAALALAAESGGSPARAVDGVAATLRARLGVADEIRALSSQARASAGVIATAPVAFGLAAAATDSRTADFFGSPSGLTLVAAGVALDGIGAWWMARLCRTAER